MTIEVTCTKCNGTGTRRLSKHLMDTFHVVSYKGEATAADVHAALDETVILTAINNRLEDLRELGLLTVRREGKQKIYSVNDKVEYAVSI